MDDLDSALIQAHEDNDFDVLIRLYRQAGEAQETLGDVDAACFYFTHAYVFALQEGADVAEALRDKLAAHGREIPLG